MERSDPTLNVGGPAQRLGDDRLINLHGLQNEAADFSREIWI
jgi:hypothetical protein